MHRHHILYPTICFSSYAKVLQQPQYPIALCALPDCDSGFFNMTAKSLNSSTLGIPVLDIQSLIMPSAVPADMPASRAIWSLGLPFRYPCITSDLIDWFDSIKSYIIHKCCKPVTKEMPQSVSFVKFTVTLVKKVVKSFFQGRGIGERRKGLAGQGLNLISFKGLCVLGCSVSVHNLISILLLQGKAGHRLAWCQSCPVIPSFPLALSLLHSHPARRLQHRCSVPCCF